MTHHYREYGTLKPRQCIVEKVYWLQIAIRNNDGTSGFVHKDHLFAINEPLPDRQWYRKAVGLE